MSEENHGLLEIRGTTERYSQRNDIILSVTSIKTTRSLLGKHFQIRLTIEKT